MRQLRAGSCLGKLFIRHGRTFLSMFGQMWMMMIIIVAGWWLEVLKLAGWFIVADDCQFCGRWTSLWAINNALDNEKSHWWLMLLSMMFYQVGRAGMLLPALCWLAVSRRACSYFSSILLSLILHDCADIIRFSSGNDVLLTYVEGFDGRRCNSERLGNVWSGVLGRSIYCYWPFWCVLFYAWSSYTLYGFTSFIKVL